MRVGEPARKELLKGINLVSDIIKTTLGAKGRNVVVKNISFQPNSMNDGFRIAEYIQHKNPVVNAGVEMIKDICRRTNELAGDGTTSTAIVSQALISEGLKEIEAGKNPVDVKRELQIEGEKLVIELKKIAKPVENSEQVKSVAAIAGNNDEEIGESVRQIYEKLGKNFNGVVEQTAERGLTTEIIEGVHWQNGFKNCVAFATNARKMEGVYSDMRVLCVNEKLQDAIDVMPFVNKMLAEVKEKGGTTRDIRLLVITKELSEVAEAINFLALNLKEAADNHSQQGQPIGFWACAVEAPRQAGALEDIAIATGGQVVAKAFQLRTAELSVLGFVKKVIAGRKSTILIGAQGDPKKIKERLDGIEFDKHKAKGEFEKNDLQARKDTLSAGIGRIFVGGASDVEAGDRYLRVEDAILAVRAAIEEGIVAGGGVTYQRLAELTDNKILKSALEAIPRQIAENAGVKYQKPKGEKGWNAQTEVFEDLFAGGVIDSAKVVRAVIEHAVSFAGMFLLTSACVIEDEEKTEISQIRYE